MMKLKKIHVHYKLSGLQYTRQSSAKKMKVFQKNNNNKLD